MAGGGLNLGAVGLIAGGWTLCWTAVNDPVGGPVAVVRDILQGKVPTPGPQVATSAGDFGAVGQAAADAVIGALPSGGDRLSTRYNLGHLQPNTVTLVNTLGPMFGIKTVQGWRPVDPFPDHPSGHAADFMINDIPNGTAVGTALARYAVANAARFKIKYVIWNRQVWTASKGWHAYTATSNPHTDHVHITVY